MQADKRSFFLRSRDFCVTLTCLADGAALTQLRDTRTKTDWFSGCASLFSLCVRHLSDNQTETLDSLTGWSLFVSSDGTQLTFNRPEIQVFLSAVPKDNASIEWTVSCSVLSEDWSLQSLTYPQLPITLVSDTSCIFYPLGPGVLVRGLPGQKLKRDHVYPSIHVSAAYMACYDEATRHGLYLGVHDRTAATKRLVYDVCPEGDETHLTLFANVPASDLTHSRNSQTLGGRLVWALFDGDWYDAALFYRSFVHAEAPWLPEFGRPDVPRWMRETPHWWSGGLSDSTTSVDQVIHATEDLGVPSAIHVYNWHRNPFDNDYPHYFPTHDFIPRAFDRLQEHGIRVMPYINGRLWDTRDQGTTDWLFSTLAKPGACKDAEQQVISETYGSKESDGSDVRLAVMCPQSGVWNDTVRSVCDRILKELNADAVYIDQIAAAPPALCCDETHNHPAGGGDWWVEAYNRMLDAIQRTAPLGKTLTTECTGEPYMRHLSGMLSWDWTHDGQVPALSAIYAGYVTYFGRNYGGAQDMEAVRIFAAQSFLYGEAMGWCSPAQYLSWAPEQRNFYRDLVQTRYRLNDFFIAGQMLRPPVVSCELPNLCGHCAGRSTAISERPVLAAVWERCEDSRRVLLVVNLSTEALEVSLQSEDWTQLPDGLNGTIDADGTLHLHLEPLSVVSAEYTA